MILIRENEKEKTSFLPLPRTSSLLCFYFEREATNLQVSINDVHLTFASVKGFTNDTQLGEKEHF